jgi:hypothetical protein
VVDATHTGCDDINEIGAGVSDMAIVLEVRAIFCNTALPRVRSINYIEQASMVIRDVWLCGRS